MTEEVFGVDISRIDADRLAAKFVSPKLLKVERALQTGKWFEYRFMNPTAATYLFANEYKKAYSFAYQQNIDTERGEHVTALPNDLFKARKSMITGVWRCRQVADAMGMPYGLYLERALHWVTRRWREKHLPQVYNLYSDFATDRVAIDWEEYQAAKVYYSKLPQYKNICYDSRVASLNQHHEHLFSLIESRSNNPILIAELVNQDLLSISRIRDRLGAEVFDQTLKAMH